MKTVKKSKTESQGIKGLLIELQKAKKDGEKLFNLILQGRAAPEAICNLVYQESLQELILFTLDHRKEVTASVSRLKSIEVRTKKTSATLPGVSFERNSRKVLPICLTTRLLRSITVKPKPLSFAAISRASFTGFLSGEFL